MAAESARSPSSPVPSSETEDFEKLVDALVEAVESYWTDGCNDQEASEDAACAARDAIRGYVSRLQSERDALRRRRPTEIDEVQIMEEYQAERTIGEAFEDAKAEAASLRSQLSRIQQTGLEMLAVVEISPKYSIGSMDNTHIPQISVETVNRWRAALRSLEGEGK